MLYNTNNSIQYYWFIYVRSNGYKYCYVIQIIQFRHIVKDFQVFQFNTNSFLQNHSFVNSKKGFKYCYITMIILFDINHLFTHRDMTNSSIYPTDGTLSSQSGLCRNSSERALHILWNARAGASPSYGLTAYPGHSLEVGTYLSADMRYSQCILQVQPTELDTLTGTLSYTHTFCSYLFLFHEAFFI